MTYPLVVERLKLVPSPGCPGTQSGIGGISPLFPEWGSYGSTIRECSANVNEVYGTVFICHPRPLIFGLLLPNSHLFPWPQRESDVIRNRWLELSWTIGGNIKWYSHCGKEYSGSSKTWKYNCHIIQQFHFWGCIQNTRKQSLKELFA